MGITLWSHLENLARRIEAEAFKDITTLAEWESQRPQLKADFLASMGLESLAPLCEVTVRELGEFKKDGYQARKIAYQMLPDCWTSATIYYPDPLPSGKLPAVLHLCGHAMIGTLHYQPRAVMLARRGYLVLIVDTIEQHDAGGDHHGTFAGGRYDWISMGYTGAGGELYNGVRALDVLASLPEVDASKIGVTGASGGGAQSFYLAVADERIAALATACGVTMPVASLVDRHLHGHCDCMYTLNRFQRCTSEFAALIAPRPALFAYASEDALFSNSEYRSLVSQAQRIYRLHECEERCQLFEYPGPHALLPETHAAINRWFDRYLAGAERPVEPPPPCEIDERDITIFNGATPIENKMALVPELLSPRGSLPLPMESCEWPVIRGAAVVRLKREVFGVLQEPLALTEVRQTGNWIATNEPTSPRRLTWRGTMSGMDIWLDFWCHQNDGNKVLLCWCDDSELSRSIHTRLWMGESKASVIFVEGRTGGWNGASSAMQHDILRGGALVGVSPTLLILQEMAPIIAFLRALPELLGMISTSTARGMPAQPPSIRLFWMSRLPA